VLGGLPCRSVPLQRQSTKTGLQGTESTRKMARIAKRTHLTPRPLGLASPLARAPLSAPLEGSPRCEVAPRVDKPVEREGRDGVMKREDALDEVGGLSTKDVSAVLTHKISSVLSGYDDC
jgi:hypothetical protein